MKMTFSVLLLVCAGAGSFGQGGALQITFDGPPTQAPGTGRVVTNYNEAGMSFRPVPGSGGFSRWGAATDPRDPDDGTAFLRAALGQSLMFSFTNGYAFGMISVDLAGYSSVVPNATVHFAGYRADSSMVETNFSVSGIVFQTYYFGAEFSDLTRVEIPTYGWSLDNIVVLPPVIFPAPPALTIDLIWSPSVTQARTRQVRLLWPTNASGHQLLFSTNLTGSNWMPVSPTPVIVGTNNVVTNEIAGRQKFYRLSAP